MLKAYDYTEKATAQMNMRDDGLFQKEKLIAQNFVLTHPIKNADHICPACGSKNGKFIFTRWDIRYQCCNECGTIFMPADKSIIDEYTDLPALNQLRASEEFQKNMAEHRDCFWDDFVMWLAYRTYRYLGRNEKLDIIDEGNKYGGLINKIRQSKMCGGYMLLNSCLPVKTDMLDSADVVICLNQLQHECNPVVYLKNLRSHLRDDGLLFLNTRLGSGFDILTLKGSAEDIFPYEHITLPSRKGLEKILEASGFQLLEITTPGTRDVEMVLKNVDKIEEGNFFVRYLINEADQRMLDDFQQFLQKSGLSSFCQVVAKKNVQEKASD